MNATLYDAHNHLQDERFAGRQEEIVRTATAAGVARMVVNGSCEDDWEDVARLARQFTTVLPSYGLHPWYHRERSPHWLEKLEARLVSDPRAAMGEIGLDRWKQDLPYEEQESVFLAQWNLAHRLNRPASIHCLKSWGRLLELIETNPGPACGFVLHSYGGPSEMINAFAQRGAHFSFPGYYLHERKEKQRDTFRRIPIERLLVETDAPDQLLPDDLNVHPLRDPTGHPINHPANLAATYQGLAELRGEPVGAMTQAITENFRRVFM